MKLFGWVTKMRGSESSDVSDERQLLHDLEMISSRSKATQERLDKIIDIEKIRLRNLELRAAIVLRTHSR